MFRDLIFTTYYTTYFASHFPHTLLGMPCSKACSKICSKACSKTCSKACSKLLDISLHHFATYFTRYAMYLYHKGNTTGAEQQLKKAVENDENHVGALADYACLKVQIIKMNRRALR